MTNQNTKRSRSTVSLEFETEQRAITLLRTQLPASWIIRPHVPDYHLDFLVEITKEGELTGVQFGIQLKGTAPKKPFKKAPKHSLKTKHTRYFLEKCNFPVFLFLADVNNSAIFWTFMQEFAKTKLVPHQLKQGTNSVSFELCRTLSDFASFQEALNAATRFMRNLWPGSIQSALAARKLELDAKDKRIKVEIDVLGGVEHFKLEALEPFDFNTKFKINDPSTFIPAFQNFIEKGKPFNVPVDELVVTGSPIFEELMPPIDSARISIAPSNPTRADLQIFVDGSQGVGIHVGGALTKGTKYLTFEGTLVGSPLTVTIDRPLNAPQTCSASFNFFENRWVGQSLVSLSFFEQMRALFDALNEDRPVRVELFKSGNRLLGGELRGLKSGITQESVMLLNFLHRLRTIFSHYKTDVVLPDFKSLRDADFETAIELSSLLISRRFESPAANFTVRFILDRNTMPLKTPIDIRMVSPLQKFQLLGQTFSLGPVQMSFSEVSIETETALESGVEIVASGNLVSRRDTVWIPDLAQL